MFQIFVFAFLEELIKFLIVVPCRSLKYGIFSIFVFYLIEAYSKYLDAFEHVVAISPRHEYAVMAFISFAISLPLLHVATSLIYLKTTKFLIPVAFCTLVHAVTNRYFETMPTLSYLGYATLGWVFAFTQSAILFGFFLLHRRYVEGTKVDLL